MLFNEREYMSYGALEDLFHNMACLLSDRAWQLHAHKGTPPRPAMLKPDYLSLDSTIWLRVTQIAFRLYFKIKANDVQRHCPLYRM